MAGAVPVLTFIGKALVGALSGFKGAAVVNFLGLNASAFGVNLGLRALGVGRPQIAIRERDLGANITDPVASLPVIYGKARIGIHRVFLKTTPAASTDKTYLWIVGALCHGPIAGIDEIYLDGRQVFDTNGRPQTVSVDGVNLPFVSYAHVWKAYGTAGQVTVLDNAAGAKTVTATLRVNDHQQRITTSAAHGFVVGDIIAEVSAVSGLAAGHGYGVRSVESSTQFTVEIPEGNAVTDGDGGGTVDHYTPNLDTLLGTDWSAEHRGRGVAYIVLRLRFNEQHFPAGLPRVEAVVRGIAAKDPRSVTTFTISSSAAGAAVTGMASTAEITTAAAHGLAVGDIVEIAGHSRTELNGTQRVDAVVDSDTFRVHTPLSGAGSGGIGFKRPHATNPAICIRDYLTNRVYGPGLTAGYKAPAGTVIVARKSASAGGGDPPASARLAAIGYTVTTDLDATVAECRAYDVVVIDCDAWSAGEHNTFIQQLWADGQKVFTAGNDTSTDAFFVSSAQAASPVGTAEPGTPDHLIQAGFTSFAEADGGQRITGVRSFALGLGSYDENAAARPWVICAHPSGGVIVHMHTPTFSTAGDTAQSAIVIGNILAFLSAWTSAEVDEAAFATEANYHDEDIQVPKENTDSFTNQRTVTGATGDGTRVTFTTQTAHGYLSTDVVRIDGFSDSDDLDGIYDIDDTPSSTTFRVLLARTGSWSPETVIEWEEGIPIPLQFGTAAVVKTINRFECHGVVDTTQSVKKNIEDLLTSCRGSLLYQTGTYRVHTRRATAAASLVLSESNIVGDWEFSGPGLGELVNAVRATFYDSTKNYVVNQVEYPGPNLPNLFRTHDNGALILRDLDLRYTTDRNIAQYIAMVLRREARNPIRVNVTCFESALALTVGDVVRVTHATPGWVEKKFWVEAMAILSDATVRLSLSEYEETAYDLDAQDDTPFAPDTNLHLPAGTDAIPVPADFLVVAITVITPSGGVAELTATYTPPADTAFFARIEYEVQARRQGDTTDFAELPTRIEQGGRDGTDRIKADWNTEYRITPVTVSTGGTRTKGTGGQIQTLSTGAQPTATPTIGTPVAFTDRIEYPITIDPATARIEVWSTQSASDPGTPTSRYKVGTREHDVHRGDGTSQTVILSLSASTNWRVTTFVAFDALDGKGTTTTLKTQGASPSLPPDITTTPTEVSDTETTTTNQVTMPGSGLAAGDKIVVYRDGAATGQEVDRTAGTGATQNIVHTGLEPSTTYVWKYKLRNAAGALSANFSPELQTTTDPGTIPTPTVALGAYNEGSQSMTVTVTPGAGTPAGTTWHLQHSTDGGAFVNVGTPGTENPFQHTHTQQAAQHTCAVKVRGTKSGWIDGSFSSSSNTVTIPGGPL